MVNEVHGSGPVHGGGNWVKPEPQNMTGKEIVAELKDPTLDKARKEALLEELTKRLKATAEGSEETPEVEGSGGSEHTPEVNSAGETIVPGTRKTLQELLEELKNGTISMADLESLAKALGIPLDQLVAMYPAVQERMKEEAKFDIKD